MTVATVRFAPGSPTAWLPHARGQYLWVTKGVARFGDRDGNIFDVHPGQTIYSAEHFHVAAGDSFMEAHRHERMRRRPRSDHGVARAHQRQRLQRKRYCIVSTGTDESPIQKLIGDFTPKLADLTDEVLFRDVWKRPELSPRDRSLITVAGLIMAGSTEQLESHLTLGKNNGLSKTELKEVMIHMAFYAGWPKALFAITVAQKVFGE